MALRASKATKQTAPPSAACELSVVVPAYHEEENIRPLCERLFKALKVEGITGELLVMDDESAGSEKTKEICMELAKEGYEVRIHARTKKEGRGLSSAVLLGFDMAKYDNMVCMDADLQHEPESVPAVAAPIMKGTADFSIGSRYTKGGGLGFEWNIVRRLISWFATMLCAPLSPSTDPMSGFFAVSKKTLSKGRAKCNPIGFKIGLEISARCRCKKIVDVGITFQERVAGESKLTMEQNILYLRQLWSLYLDQWTLLLWVIFGILFSTGFIAITVVLLYKFVTIALFIREVANDTTGDKGGKVGGSFVSSKD